MSGRSPKPIYVLHGQDDYLRRQYRREIAAGLAGSEETQLAVTNFDSSAALSEVLDELRTAPLLAPRRLVILHDADDFVSKHRQALEEYLDSPSPTGSLILVVRSWPGNTRLARRAREIGEIADCSSPDERSLPRWISRAAQDRGKRISPDAAALLSAWVGPDLARLDAEIEKLALYTGRRQEISTEDVAAAVVATAGPVPFALTDAIATGNAKTAVEALHSLLTRRGEEFRVLGLIAWHLRRGLQSRLMRPPLRPGSAGWRPLAELRKDFRRVLQADLGLKTGAEPAPTMQLLVTKLCHPAT
jgi:DNA polymerase-3 subunit delta